MLHVAVADTGHAPFTHIAVHTRPMFARSQSSPSAHSTALAHVSPKPLSAASGAPPPASSAAGAASGAASASRPAASAAASPVLPIAASLGVVAASSHAAISVA